MTLRELVEASVTAEETAVLQPIEPLKPDPVFKERLDALDKAGVRDKRRADSIARGDGREWASWRRVDPLAEGSTEADPRGMPQDMPSSCCATTNRGGEHMSDTIELLDAIGRDASLRYASAERLAGVLEQVQASMSLKAAAAAGDVAGLIRELGGKPSDPPPPNQLCPPAEEDEEQEEEGTEPRA